MSSDNFPDFLLSFTFAGSAFSIVEEAKSEEMDDNKTARV